jgi:hypothetical protein
MIKNEFNESSQEPQTNRIKDESYISKNMSKIFPTRTSFVVFVCYMALFINQGIFKSNQI